jgi:SAM-dependent methyltransferase
VRHYSVPGLLDAILRALRAQGKDPERLTPADLAPVDEFHIRGRQATAELAELAGFRAGLRVLDVGSGLGGAARFFAVEHGCLVTGADLTHDYCSVAAALSKTVALYGATRFLCASALEMPFADESFDVAYSQHVQMNVEDKPAFYREIARVLRPGGRFVFHDILAGPGGPPHFPVHWAEEPSMSFLIDPAGLRLLLERAGFGIAVWLDKTEISRQWYLAAWEQRRDAGAPQLGLHLLMGPTAPLKFENVARNLQENRIMVFQGVAEK